MELLSIAALLLGFLALLLGAGVWIAVALMATVNSVLSHRFPDYYWTGFYRVCGDRLVVGPYIGTVGCLQIEIGRGVCGTAAHDRRTVIVPDVSQFPGHIACDARSKSEVGVPVFAPDGALVAVFDVDSDRVGAFDDEDRAGLERIMGLFGARAPLTRSSTTLSPPR